MREFFYVPGPAPTLIEGVYAPELVALSVVVVMLSAILAFQIVHASQCIHHRGARQVAMFSGALVLSSGVWGLHFIGMLAMDICSSVDFVDWRMLMSWGFSFAGALAVMWSLASYRARQKPWVRRVAALAMALGVGVMHFMGTESLSDAFELRYAAGPFWATWGLAVLGFVVALEVRALLAARPRVPRWVLNSVAGTLLGGLIACVHYTGMASTRFLEQKDVLIPGDLDEHFIWFVALAIVVASFGSLAGNAFLRFREATQGTLKIAERLRTVLESSTDALMMVDHAGAIVSVNPAGLAMYGYTEAELVKQPVRMLLSDSYRASFDAALARADLDSLARQVASGVELKMQRADSSKFPARVSLGRSMVDGELVYMVFIADISERVRGQQALQQREQQLSSLMSSMPGASYRYIANRERTPLFISDGIQKICGWAPEAFLDGRVNYVSLIHPEDLAKLPQLREEALQKGQSCSLTYRIHTLYGEERWVNDNSTVTCDAKGRPAFIDGVILDVTEDKKRSAELEGVVKAMHRALSIIEFDMNGNVTSVNDKFTELAGYTTEMMQDLPQKQFLPKTEEEMRNHEELWSRLRAGEVVEKEFYRKHRNGSDLYVFSYYNPIFGPDGKPYKVMSFSTNLTERYAMERELRQAKEKAETAVVAKSAFLANMSHELRTPMNAILGFTDILLDEPMAEDHKRYLRTVHASAESLLKLLNDILDTAKLDYGAVELEIAPFSLKDSCRQTLAMVAVLAEEKGLDLQLDYPAPMPESFMGDRVRVQQILLNLVGNAVKFTEKGQVRMVCRYEGDVVQIAVQDTGIGIPQDRMAKIFEPFVQADASMTRRFGGTGLGTTIARQLAELMGGRIEARSEEGVGSEFRLELPLALNRSGTVSLLQSTVALEPMHVLLVDDVPQNLDLLTVLLSKGGHTWVAAADGLEAVEKFQQDHFDAILMDLQMPVMDGFQATQAIRLIETEAAMPRTPVIAVTANAMDSDRDAAVQAGMDGFVAKPVQQNALYAEMRRLCAAQEA